MQIVSVNFKKISLKIGFDISRCLSLFSVENLKNSSKCLGDNLHEIVKAYFQEKI